MICMDIGSTRRYLWCAVNERVPNMKSELEKKIFFNEGEKKEVKVIDIV